MVEVVRLMVPCHWFYDVRKGIKIVGTFGRALVDFEISLETFTKRRYVRKSEMSNLLNVLLTILIAMQLKEIDCNPVQVEKDINAVQRNVRVFKPDRKEWTHFHHSWGLPHFPSLPSVTSLFQDEEDIERIAMKKRLEELEKNQKEILGLLQKLTNELSTKKDQPTAGPLNEKPQTPSSLDDKKPMSDPSIEKVTASKETEKEIVSSAGSSIGLETAPSISPSTSSATVPSTVSPSASTIVVSTIIDTTETRAPVTETINPQETSQESRTSSTSEEPRPQEPDQKEKVDPNLNPNAEDNQESDNAATNEENPTTVDTNSISIVAFSSDQNEEPAVETELSA